jgi:hypothetical protein
MMKHSRFAFLFGALLFGATAIPQSPPANYDESKVPQYVLPDPLLMLNGKKVKDVKTWQKKRRPEILGLFETQVYGRTMIGRPNGMTWEVTATDNQSLARSAITKTVAIYFAGKKDGPLMELYVILPADARKPVPVFLMPTIFNPKPEKLLSRGYGLAYFNPAAVEPDNVNGYPKSIRAFFAKPGQTGPGPDEWGAIGAWAWAMSRAMDYLVNDPDVDSGRVSIMGVSRVRAQQILIGLKSKRKNYDTYFLSHVSFS